MLCRQKPTYNKTIRFISYFVLRQPLKMPKKLKSSSQSRISQQNEPMKDVYDIPLPGEILTSACSGPLQPPPFATALTCYLAKLETAPRTVEENSSKTNLVTSPVIFKVNERCYQLPESEEKSFPKRNNKCYELPLVTSTASNNCKSDKVSSNTSEVDNSGSFYVTEMARVENVKKRLSVLKSTENMDRKGFKVEEFDKECNHTSTAESIMDHSKKLETNTTPRLKRSHSMISDEEFTPKRKLDRHSERSSKSTSPSNSYEQRKHSPSTSDSRHSIGHSEKSMDSILNSIRRRKSCPSSKPSNTVLKSPSTPMNSSLSLMSTSFSSKSPSLNSSTLSMNSPVLSPFSKSYKRCRTDQTPYESGKSHHQHKRMRPMLPYYNAFELMDLESESGFIDSHCHLDFLFDRQGYHGTYTEYQEKHKETFPKCYKGCLAIFCNPFTFHKKYKWEKFLKESNVWASFGCHPHNAKDYNDAIEQDLIAALDHSKVRALGEIGLDYSNRNNCQKEAQFDAFRRQLKIALEKSLPVVIHCREAHEDGMAVIKEILPMDYTIHLHCFTDTWEWAQKWLEEFPNLFIGITNVVTFPSAENVHEVARNIPLSRLLLETDAPYFVPRGGPKGLKFSHPGMAIHVAAQIAALKSIPLEKVLQATRKNTKQMYNI